MSNFAKLQLLKYGWTEGKGLGKNENGIVKALKPNLKFDTAGIGHDGSEYKWWENIYNKASSNLHVTSSSEQAKVHVKDDGAVEIATSKAELTLKKTKKNQDLQYGNFIKTSTLQDGKHIHENNYSEELFQAEPELSVNLTDEELLLACGGRTAHKGARHGLKLSGKLARIDKQEQELLAKQDGISAPSDWIQVKTKRKKKKTQEKIHLYVLDVVPPNDDNVQVPPNDFIDTDLSEDLPTPKSEKSKRKAKRKLEDLTHKLSTSLDLCEHSDVPVLKKRKKSQKKLSTEFGDLAGEGKEIKSETNRSNFLIRNYGDAFKDTGCNDDGFVSEDNSTEPSVKSCAEAKRLNDKIKKKKKKKMEKQQRKKFEKLSETLKTLNLEVSTEENVEKKVTRKKLGKRRS